MSDEKGRKAGSISKFKQQYGKLGRGETSERLDSEASKSQAIQPSEQLDIQPLEHSTIQESKLLEVESSSSQTIQPSKSLESEKSSMQKSPVVEHPSTQKSKQQRDKLTVYLEPELNDWIRQQIIIEKRKRGHHVEISDIINESLRKAMESQ